MRVQQRGGGVCRVQVVVENAAYCRLALLFAVVAVGQLGGVGAEQVVQAVPAGGVFEEKVGVGQLGKKLAGLA